ncbi:hypothetical protein T440DRAFT_478352 [Plenodomus tracheiphilus IPT5]|uniref:Uncharacterized protein n=1 Tax=Plenodomus tracheiphilus IPT5 TaxID=1408161 RepID=A0A6A7BBR6_9PLEO|nr:hypothetical protein T440DRAFT_478352 [Plenodomus tracheiphilus IPT5]
MSITPTPAQHLAGSTPGNAIVISSAPGDDVSAPGPSMTPRTAPKCPASTPWKERLAYLHRQINSLDKPVAYELLKGFQALSPSQKNYYCNKHWSSSNEDALTNLHDMACLSPKFSTIYYLMLGYSVKKEDALNIANEAERQAALEKVESDYDTIFLEQQEKCKYELKIIQLQSQIAQQSNLKNNIASKKQGERKKEHIAKIMKKIKVLEEEMAEQVMLAGMSIAQRKQIVTGRRDKIVANIAVTGRAAQEVRTQRAERAREAGEERERKKAEDKAAEDAAKAAAAAEKEEAAEQEAAGRLEYLEARYAELQAKGDAAGAARVKRQLKAPARSAGPGQKRKAGADDNATPASKRTRTRASRQEQEQEQEQESHREEEELSAEDLMAAFAADDDEDADADADADAHIPTSATLPTPPQDQSQELLPQWTPQPTPNSRKRMSVSYLKMAQ